MIIHFEAYLILQAMHECVCVFVICVGAPILLLIKWNDIL